ncbi:MAG: N-6 DNA methylase [Opitutae bacterium]|nr:N-6 DNA methylase [Opitutae bacterium]
MPIPPSILERIETFRRNLDSYLQPDYKEARVRQEFIDPFFAALGWDVRNEQGYAEAYKDVVHEDTLRLAGAGTTAPDYSFRIGGTRKFFVEAKKPFVRLRDDPEPALQLRRYSFSAKLALGLVTDFQEFAIYDTRLRPREGDKASVARLFYCTYEQFAEKWDEIAGIFSRESVLTGSFDKFAATNKGKRGTSDFDGEFLKDMEHWRELLARNLALRNATLSERELNFAVQRILDRIVFLRIAEDRGIEPYGQLQALTAGAKIYPRLGEIFERADFRYNSGLFHFATEKGRAESPDKLTLRLTLDDAPLREIIGALYWPKSPYAFAVIPADILGHVYEQFLGKVIHLTPDHRARVEEKPEVRKAGGVYYTPTYIVDYIVRQTVGPLVEGKTPKQIEKIKVLDPACGSGSFLLGAYDYLLDWHLRYYLDHDPAAWAKKKNPPVYETSPNAGRDSFGQPLASHLSPPARNWQLTTAERKRILVAHLHGVDIDAQAVEVTKLSLLLKVLEGEARELRGRQLDFHRVLPDLGQNIKCGNSLIGSDFYAQADLPAFDDEARRKINAFDWAHEFKSIVVEAGGFDAVIGNPPYGADIESACHDYLRSHFAAVTNSFDSFIMFMEQAGNLLATRGRLGVIIPSGWVSTPSSRKLRLRFAEQYKPEAFASLPYDVFAGAYIDTMIVVASRMKRAENWKLLSDGSVSLVVFPVRHKVNGPDDFRAFAKTGDFTSWVDSQNSEFLVLSSRDEAKLVAKLRAAPTTLQAFAEVMRGVEVFHPRPRAECKSPRRAFNGDLLRYRFDLGPPAFESFTPEIEEAKPLRFFSGPRILLRQLLSRKFRLQAIFTCDEFLTNQSVQSLVPRGEFPDARALLGILNSKLLSWYFCQINLVARRDDFPKTIIKQTRELPFPRIDAATKLARAQHDALVAHVERMLKLHTDLAAAKSSDAQTHLARDIAATDRAIDALVYQLYGLTPAEFQLVEQATAPAIAPADAPGPADPPALKPPPPPKPPPADRTPFRYLTPAEFEARDIDFGVQEDPPRASPGHL